MGRAGATSVDQALLAGQLSSTSPGPRVRQEARTWDAVLSCRWSIVVLVWPGSITASREAILRHC